MHGRLEKKTCYLCETAASFEHKVEPMFNAIVAMNTVMRIALLYNRDIYALSALNRLLPALDQHELALFFSSQVGAHTIRDPRLVSLASYEKTFSTHSNLSFEALAAKTGRDEQRIEQINGRDLAHLSAFKPDLIISIRFGQILKAAAIAVPSIGVINLHSGLLPHYKGVMASFWSLLRDEAWLGTTLHWITDSQIDSGHLISTRSHPINPAASYAEQVMSLYAAGVEQILEAVANIHVLAAEPRTKLPTGNYFSFPTAADIDLFESKGWRLY
jgi:methionyl-tRNA formyltransferase